MPGDPKFDADAAKALGALRGEFPDWRIVDGPGPLPWNARQFRHRPPGGIVHIMADTPEHLRELLAAADEINARYSERAS